jgi:hypothetical protein
VGDFIMAKTIRTITRPVVCLLFICAWIAMIFLKVDYPAVFWMMACLSGLEWISERAVKRFREIFGHKVEESE